MRSSETRQIRSVITSNTIILMLLAIVIAAILGYQEFGDHGLGFGSLALGALLGIAAGSIDSAVEARKDTSDLVLLTALSVVIWIVSVCVGATVVEVFTPGSTAYLWGNVGAFVGGMSVSYLMGTLAIRQVKGRL